MYYGIVREIGVDRGQSYYITNRRF